MTGIAVVLFLVPGSGATEIEIGIDELPMVIDPGLVTVVGSCGGHPFSIKLEALLPDASEIKIAECDDAIACEGSADLWTCGLWQFRCRCLYAHTIGGEPYSAVATADAIVVGCEIFADGFEVGDTSNWTRAVP